MRNDPDVVLAVDPGMASGAVITTLPNGEPWYRSWSTPKQLAAAVADARAEFGALGRKVWIVVEGSFARVEHDVSSVPGSTAKGRSRDKRPKVYRLTGLKSVERCAGAWEVEAAANGWVFCARPRWSDWSPPLIARRGARIPRAKADPLISDVAAQEFPGLREQVTKKAWDHLKDAIGMRRHRLTLHATGVKPKELTLGSRRTGKKAADKQLAKLAGKGRGRRAR